jgi:CubicO group peptidase (beta-lactamase class C family)
MDGRRVQVAIQAAIDEFVASGAEIGLQVAVIKHGRVVVDAVSGVADPPTGVAVSADTLFWAGPPPKVLRARWRTCWWSAAISTTT